MLSVPLQDFESNNELKTKVIVFLEEVMHDPELLTQERKAAANIIRYRCVPFGCGITIYYVNNPTFEKMYYTVHTSAPDLLLCFLSVRTLTQEDHGDSQITLEDVTQLVSKVSIGKQDFEENTQIYPYLYKSTRSIMEKSTSSTLGLQLTIIIIVIVIVIIIIID